ncbi:hypothetical protein V7S43_015438 [Phytophthora oleae]|uniref:Uncharacterized protein n=1 Tax=Phytophthora oleae TaxID=2107226 RepID=A0ABD3EZ18_9STRA
MRIVPLQCEQARADTSALTRPFERADSRVRSQDAASEHLYELEPAQPLPTFDLNKTLVSTLLPSDLHEKLSSIMHRRLNSLLVTLFRVSLLFFGCFLFVPVKFILPGLPLMVAAIVLPPVIFVTFFSLDVLVLLAHHYEFWFVTTLNTLNWLGLSVIFGDIRAISCFGLWLSSQSVVLIDSNYRTFPTAVKSIIISGPFLILLVVCCSYNLVVDASYPVIKSGQLTLQSRQIVVFTASTLFVFVVKKAYTKNRRLRLRLRDREADPDSAQGLHTIPCVGLHARLKLTRYGPKRSIGQLQFGTSTMRNLLTLAPRSRPVDLTNVQKLRLSPYDPLIVDGRNVVLSEKLLKWMEAPYAQGLIYLTGVVGLSATAIVWLMILYNQQGSNDPIKTVVAAIAGVSSLVFMFVVFSLAQRDLLRLVAWNFDVLFSTFQGTALAVFLLDLLRWKTASNLAVMAWWLWFHCLLVLDALTPSLTQQLNIRKHFGLPAVIVVLAVATGCALELIVGDDDEVFSSRLLWSMRLRGTGFELHTSSLAIQRTVTIVGWFPRLLIELATGSPDQLLFIHRQVEFFSPYVTFSDPVPSKGQTTRSLN